jgi:hypothetical protein
MFIRIFNVLHISQAGLKFVNKTMVEDPLLYRIAMQSQHPQQISHGDLYVHATSQVYYTLADGMHIKILTV